VPGSSAHGHGECEAENAVCFGALPFWDARIGRASMVDYFKSMLKPHAGIVSVLDRCDGFVRIWSCLDDFYGMEDHSFRSCILATTKLMLQLLLVLQQVSPKKWVCQTCNVFSHSC
jgi:hypothetical protein